MPQQIQRDRERSLCEVHAAIASARLSKKTHTTAWIMVAAGLREITACAMPRRDSPESGLPSGSDQDTVRSVSRLRSAGEVGRQLP